MKADRTVVPQMDSDNPPAAATSSASPTFQLAPQMDRPVDIPLDSVAAAQCARRSPEDRDRY